jgi:hypothetical protein
MSVARYRFGRQLTLASVVGCADVVLGPIVNGAVASAWRHWRHAWSRTEIVGAEN